MSSVAMRSELDQNVFNIRLRIREKCARRKIVLVVGGVVR